MTPQEYARLVQSMRIVQKRFFKGDRSSATLDEARKLERAVDEATSEILGGEGRLFA